MAGIVQNKSMLIFAGDLFVVLMVYYEEALPLIDLIPFLGLPPNRPTARFVLLLENNTGH